MTSGSRSRIREFRVVVVGDEGTGKSSLIAAAQSGKFPDKVSRVLTTKQFKTDSFDGPPLQLIDTSSRNELELSKKLKQATVVVLTYSGDRPKSLERLTSYWLPKFREWEVKWPVFLVECKKDVPYTKEETKSLKARFRSLSLSFGDLFKLNAEGSAKINPNWARSLFHFAIEAVIYPTAPLYDKHDGLLSYKLVRALRRIFALFDVDGDGLLSDKDLDSLEVKVWNAPMDPEVLERLKSKIRKKAPCGIIDPGGINFKGFLYIHRQNIRKGRYASTWILLNKCGYDDTIKFKAFIPHSFDRYPDQSVELTLKAMEFLQYTFSLLKGRKEGVLLDDEVEAISVATADSPWDDPRYKSEVPLNDKGELEFEGYWALWVLMALREPSKALTNLIDVGYNKGHYASAFHITRNRRLDLEAGYSDRSVFQGFVFGPRGGGKSALLDLFLGRSFSGRYESTTVERYAPAIVRESSTNATKALVLREIPEDGVQKLLSSKESFAACDLAIFVYDSTSEESEETVACWLKEISIHGKFCGFEVPCLVFAAKWDIVGENSMFPHYYEKLVEVCRYLSIEDPIPVSMKDKCFSEVSSKILKSAKYPHAPPEGIPGCPITGSTSRGWRKRSR